MSADLSLVPTEELFRALALRCDSLAVAMMFNFSKDDERHTTFFHGSPAGVVYAVKRLDMAVEDRMRALTAKAKQ